MATIALDATYSLDAEPTGIAMYSRRLVESLLELETIHRFLVCYRLSRWRRREAFLRPSSGRRFAVRLFQEPFTFWLPWQAEIFHSLAQRPPGFRFPKEVVTVFDVFPITGKNYSTPEFQRKFGRLLRDAVQRADLVITASGYTARELQRHCGVPVNRIRVIPVGVDLPEVSPSAEDRRMEREGWVGRGNELVLVVGAIQTRKNTLGAARSAALLPERYRFVLAGGNGHGSDAVHEFVRRNQLSGRIIRTGYVSPLQLESLYRAASVLLFPSFEEGFGIPVLEAMARRVPVVAACTSSLPEVGGEAALYVDPHSDAAIVSAVRQVIEDEALRSRLISLGLDRAAQFTWRRTAQETLDVYEEVLAGTE